MTYTIEGAAMYVCVPAYWDPDPQSTGDPGELHGLWSELAVSLTQGLPGAGSAALVVFGYEGWPSIARAESTIGGVKSATGCTALGYVDVRDPQTKVLRDPAAVNQMISDWLTTCPSLDGMYLDEAFMPGRVADAEPVKDLIAAFRLNHPDKKVMAEGTQVADEYLGAGAPRGPDYALTWETDLWHYESYYGASSVEQGNVDLPTPSWWKDPARQSSIVHVLSQTDDTTAPKGASSPSAGWQSAVGLALERNAGAVFVLDTGQPYNHLPDGWEDVLPWINSYNERSIGLAPHLLLRAAHLWARGQGKVHGWPNGEQAFHGGGAAEHQVRGTYTLDVPLSGDIGKTTIDLPGSPPLYDVAAVWAAAHRWAVGTGTLTTAWPTFVEQANGQYEVITLSTGLPWLTVATLSNTYQAPLFTEPYALLRNLHRVAQPAAATALPTFQADPGSYTGLRLGGADGAYQAAVLRGDAPVTWQDVPGLAYSDLV